MPATPAGEELLERSLGYLRTVLARVTDADLGAPTPCRGWDLDLLLRHLDDALDAFAEAALGEVGLPDGRERVGVLVGASGTGARPRVARLRAKAGALLGDWSGSPAPVVDVGGLALPAQTVAAAAALEVAVHGWDVAATLGVPCRAPSLPPALAARLWPVAQACVQPVDRGLCFDAAVPVAAGVGADVRLLAFLGRRTP